MIAKAFALGNVDKAACVIPVRVRLGLPEPIFVEEGGSSGAMMRHKR